MNLLLNGPTYIVFLIAGANVKPLILRSRVFLGYYNYVILSQLGAVSLVTLPNSIYRLLYYIHANAVSDEYLFCVKTLIKDPSFMRFKNDSFMVRFRISAILGCTE